MMMIMTRRRKWGMLMVDQVKPCLKKMSTMIHDNDVVMMVVGTRKRQDLSYRVQKKPKATHALAVAVVDGPCLIRTGATSYPAAMEALV